MRYVLSAFLLFSALPSSGIAADIILGSALVVAPGGEIPLDVSLVNAAPPGGVTVTLTSSDTSKITISPQNIYIPGGLTTGYGQPRITGVSFGAASISASAYGLAGSSQNVQVSATLSGPLSQAVLKGTSVNATFSLPWATPNAVTLAVRSDNPGVASVSPTATILAGASSTVIPISGVAVGTTTLHISELPDIPEFLVSVNVFTAGSITLTPVTLTLGQSLPFPVALGAPAPGAGVTLSLSSSDPLTVPISVSSVFIPGGQTTPATQPEILGENIGAVTITVSGQGYLTTNEVVPVTATITTSPSTLRMPVGGYQILSLVLSAAAPSVGVPITADRAAGGFVNGLTVHLYSSDPRVAMVQPTVQFYPDGSAITTVVVVVNGAGQGTAIIHAGAPPFIPDATAIAIVGTPITATPASLAATGGTPQTAQVNTPFGLPLSVTALDSSSNPVSGVTVTFGMPPGGPGATFAGGVNTAVTDASGVARSQTLTANGLAGTYPVAASATGVAVPAIFTLTNQAAASGGAINLPGSLSVSPNQSQLLTVTLSTPAPPNGVTVTLTSSDPTKATVPATVFIAGSATTPASQPNVTGVNFGSTTIGASAPGYASASLLVQVSGTLTFTPPSMAINGIGTQNLTLALSSPAPAGGLTITLTSSNTGAATVPPSVTFAGNASSVAVPVTGVATGSTTITAAAGIPNVPNATATVTVSTGADISLPAGIVLSPYQSATLPVLLAKPAAPGGVIVTLSSSDNSKVTINHPNIYFPEGSTTPLAQPQVTGVNYGASTVSATAYGLTGATQTVQVIGKLSGPLSQTIQLGSTFNVLFGLSGPTSNSITLAVRSDNPGVASVPATVTIPANGTTAVVPVTAVSAGTTVVHISALPDIAESTVSISVQTPGTITIANGVSVPLGASAALPVTIGAPAPAGGLVISLSSSNPGTVSIAPNSVFIPAGATTSATNAVVTGNDIGLATISASAPGYLTASRDVPVTATITLSPTAMVIPVGGTRLLAMALSSAAPSSGPITPDRGSGGYVNGLTVNLSSSNPGVAWLQPTVQFYPDGSSITTVVVVVSGLTPGTAVLHVSALPFIPDVTATVTVQ